MDAVKVYISGPVTYGGTRAATDAIRSAFTVAAGRIRQAGDQPVNPLDINAGQADMSWEACMKRDLAELIKCDAIYLLPGWAESRGASREAVIATELGLRLWTPEIEITGDSTLDALRLSWARTQQRLLEIQRDGHSTSAPTPDDPWLAPVGSLVPPHEQRPLQFSKSGEFTFGEVNLPRRAYSDDAGLDLFVSETVTVHPGLWTDIHCNIAVVLPDGVWGLVIGRSSTLRYRGLVVNPGIIDTGYRGELFTCVLNVSVDSVTVEQGERLAQLILLPNVTAHFRPEWTDELPGSPRGTAGFGSSGQ